ncbi:MAG: glycosyltransferase family 1 protein [Candidatus Komeilibacteria bacterium]
MSLTIALDCRPLQEAEPTGIATYVSALRRQLLIEPNVQLKTFSIGNQSPTQITSPEHTHYSVPGKLFNFLSALNIDCLPRNPIAEIYLLPHPTFWPIRRKPYILTIHDLAFIERPYYYNLRQRLWHRTINFQRLAENAAALVCVSEATKARLLQLYPQLKAKPLATIHEGLVTTELTDYQERAILSRLQLPDKYLLYLGTIEPRKNLPSLLAAWQLVHRLRPEIHLVIAGKYGWSSQTVIRRLLVDKNIRWLQYISDEEKSILYRRAQAFVWPSWYEGFGFPPLEAAYWGTPVITSWSTALPEMLINRAHYVNPYNYKELADCLLQILDQPREERLSKELAAQFNWGTATKALIKFIESL